MGKTFEPLDSPISYEAPARTAVDRAFERRFWRRDQSASTFDRPSSGRPWLVWLLIILSATAIAAFSAWPGAGISRDASRTAVGSDAVWNGVIRQTGRASAKDPAANDSVAMKPLSSSASAQIAAVLPESAVKQPRSVSALRTVAMIAPEAPAKPAASKPVAVKPALPALDAAPAKSTVNDRSGLGDPTVLSIQGLLKRLGYDPGPIDGLPGNRTRAAIMAWQLDQGLEVNGESSQQVLQWLLDPVGTRQAASRLSIKSLSSHERAALETWCTTGRNSADLPGYYHCLNAQMVALADGFRLPEAGASGVSAQSIKFARASCTNALARGPQTYFQCVDARSRLAPELSSSKAEPDTSDTSTN